MVLGIALLAVAGIAVAALLSRWPPAGPSSRAGPSPAGTGTLSPVPPRAACPARGEPVALRFEFAPGVPAADRGQVRRGIRLGREAFGLRNTFCRRDDVRVRVLDRPGPVPAKISTWSIGGEVRVFTESPDWLASPFAARLETMLHEMYHVVQYYRAVASATHPQWLVEGSAVWAAATAAARHGLYPSYEAAVGPVLLDADPSTLRRAETPAGWVHLDRPYVLAFRATEALLEGDHGMERLDRYWRLLAEHNAGRAGHDAVEWRRPFRDAFGIRAARFYAHIDRVL